MSAGPYCQGCGWSTFFGGHKPGCKGPPPEPDPEVRFFLPEGGWEYRTVPAPFPETIGNFKLYWTDGQQVGDKIVPYYQEK